jgi:hypothetical protein
VKLGEMARRAIFRGEKVTQIKIKNIKYKNKIQKYNVKIENI